MSLLPMSVLPTPRPGAVPRVKFSEILGRVPPGLARRLGSQAHFRQAELLQLGSAPRGRLSWRLEPLFDPITARRFFLLACLAVANLVLAAALLSFVVLLATGVTLARAGRKIDALRHTDTPGEGAGRLRS